jgi:CRISPR/Cas system endoribonuclease Cas6 (RAMP superfamily)
LDDKRIDVVDLDLQSQEVNYRREYLLGLVGNITYNIQNLSPSERIAMAAFSQIGQFSGCGSRTTAGFGAVEVSFG